MCVSEEDGMGVGEGCSGSAPMQSAKGDPELDMPMSPDLEPKGSEGSGPCVI